MGRSSKEISWSEGERKASKGESKKPSRGLRWREVGRFNQQDSKVP